MDGSAFLKIVTGITYVHGNSGEIVTSWKLLQRSINPTEYWRLADIRLQASIEANFN